MQQTTSPPSEIRQKRRIAGFSLLQIVGKWAPMEKRESKTDANSDETIVSPEDDADELNRRGVNHDFRAFLTRVFHGIDVRGRA